MSSHSFRADDRRFCTRAFSASLPSTKHFFAACSTSWSSSRALRSASSLSDPAARKASMSASSLTMTCSSMAAVAPTRVKDFHSSSDANTSATALEKDMSCNVREACWNFPATRWSFNTVRRYSAFITDHVGSPSIASLIGVHDSGHWLDNTERICLA